MNNFQQSEELSETQLFNLSKKLEDPDGIKDEFLQKSLIQIHKEILKVQEESYKEPLIEKLMATVPVEELCKLGVEQYVGNVTSPRNMNIMMYYLEQAEKNAKTQEEKDIVEFYTLYLRKLDSIQIGDKNEFDYVNNRLLVLCHEKKHPIAMHIVAKEVYKIALNMIQGKFKKNKKEMMAKSFEMFNEALEKGSNHSVYYLGEMFENGDAPGGIDLKQAYELFLIAASFNSPQAYFKLAKYHREGLVTQKSPELEYLYTKRAAELGMVEAQHNLGCMYLDGNIVEADSIKALAWFTQSGAAGFPHSQYNAAKIYIEGGADGKVKRNMDVALVWLERLQKSGSIDVSKIIKKIVEIAEYENESKEQQENTIKSDST